jgi:HTH-type transcriptional regulator/antitoxin HigA
MKISPIRSKTDYKNALAHAAKLVDIDPPKSSDQGKLLEVLAILIEDYEKKNFPIGPADPISAIEFQMEQAGLTVKDLVPSIGAPNRVYEILNGKRPLTLTMIKNLNKNLGIPIESLIG